MIANRPHRIMTSHHHIVRPAQVRQPLSSHRGTSNTSRANWFKLVGVCFLLFDALLYLVFCTLYIYLDPHSTNVSLFVLRHLQITGQTNHLLLASLALIQFHWFAAAVESSGPTGWTRSFVFPQSTTVSIIRMLTDTFVCGTVN